jgi:uncharacterized alpha-E superfamily protein
LPSLLARFAENSFWLARYIERAENLARLLDVNETYAQDSRGEQDWLPIVQLHSDDAQFFASHEAATADAVLPFYILDRTNPTSIIASVIAARENARSLRHLISTEAWTQLNVFYNRLQALGPADLTLARLSSLCASVKEDCQAHTGIVEGTFYRDDPWLFYQLGKHIERADSTTRLLDIDYHRFLADGGDGPVDASQWNALLRSVAGYQAFRRVHPRGMVPSRVAGFLIADPAFPRSIKACLDTVGARFHDLSALRDLTGRASVPGSLRQLERIAAEPPSPQQLTSGLHDFLDLIQRLLIRLTAELGVAFFGHGHDLAESPPDPAPDDLPLSSTGQVQRASGDVQAQGQP